MKKYMVFIFVFMLFSCSKYTEKSATTAINKANTKFPSTVAKLARDKYPCIITKSDTFTSTIDSLIFVDCPQSVSSADVDFFAENTALKQCNKAVVNSSNKGVVKVPIYIKYGTQIIHDKIEDSAKIKLYADSLKLSNTLVSTQSKLITLLEKKISKRNTILLYLIIALLLSILVNIIQFKFKL